MKPEQSAMPFVQELSDYEREVREWGVSHNSLFQRCVDKWGEAAQIYQATEECMELGLALHHILREKKMKALNHVIEEVADVELMLAQVKYMLQIPDESVRVVKKKKIRRLRRLLKK